MKIPTLPRLGMPKLALRQGGPAWRTTLAGILIFVVTFLTGFLLALPVPAIRQKIIDSFRSYQVAAELRELSLSPLLALRGEGLSLRMDSGAPAQLMIDSFRCRPLWLSLLSTAPGAKVDAALLGGELTAELYRGGRIDAQARSLHLNLPLGEGTATLTGTLSSGGLKKEGEAVTAESALSLAFTDLQLQSPLLGTPGSRPLSLGTLNIEARGRGQTFNITRLESRGGDLVVSGNGNILFGRTAAGSPLNLTLNLRPSPSLSSSLKGLLEMLLPRSGDGSYQLRVAGNLARPIVQTPGPGLQMGSPPAVQPVAVPGLEAESAAPPAEPAVGGEENGGEEAAPANRAPDGSRRNKTGWQPGRSLQNR